MSLSVPCRPSESVTNVIVFILGVHEGLSSKHEFRACYTYSSPHKAVCSQSLKMALVQQLSRQGEAPPWALKPTHHITPVYRHQKHTLSLMWPQASLVNSTGITSSEKTFSPLQCSKQSVWTILDMSVKRSKFVSVEVFLIWLWLIDGRV